MKSLSFAFISIAFLVCCAGFSIAGEPLQASLLWKSDLNVGAPADFLVKTESSKHAEGPLGLVNDLKFYSVTREDFKLCHEEKDIGEVLGIFHTGQIDSPLITISTKNGRLFDIRGFYYDAGKVKRGFEFSSISFPEIVVRKSGGVYVVARFKDSKDQLMAKVFFYYAKNWAKFAGDVPSTDRLTGVQKSSNY